MHKFIIEKLDNMYSPIQGLIAGASSAGISIMSLLEYGTMLLGFFGALFGFLTAVGSFYLLLLKIKRDRQAAKNQKRRSSDKKKNR